jgi:hypothetical protein
MIKPFEEFTVVEQVPFTVEPVGSERPKNVRPYQ